MMGYIRRYHPTGARKRKKKGYGQGYLPVRPCADMPAPLRHNLARIRAQLSLTQADLAKLVGCSLPTIKAVEIGKLRLSDSLASRISQALEIWDKDWLLKNDLNTPLPPILVPRSNEEDAQAAVILEYFTRFFAAVAKMDKHRARLMIELSVAAQLDALRKEHVPRAHGKLPETIVPPGAIRWLIDNPHCLDQDLRDIVNLEGLLKSVQRDYSSWESRWAKKASPKRPKSPSRTQGSPSPADQRKKPRSS
jgi:transcriptional regulator with XRE-family HTH domain